MEEKNNGNGGGMGGRAGVGRTQNPGAACGVGNQESKIRKDEADGGIVRRGKPGWSGRVLAGLEGL